MASYELVGIDGVGNARVRLFLDDGTSYEQSFLLPTTPAFDDQVQVLLEKVRVSIEEIEKLPPEEIVAKPDFQALEDVVAAERRKGTDKPETAVEVVKAEAEAVKI